MTEKKKKKEKVVPLEPSYRDEDGNLVWNLDATEDSSDWLRAGRLREKGDKESMEELERMSKTRMGYVVEEDEEEG